MPNPISGEQQTDPATHTSVVSVRLTRPQRDALSRKANQCRMALSAFIRACALSQLGDMDMESLSKPKAKRLSTTERQQIAMVLACMGRLMDCIRDFSDTPPETQDQHIMLAALRREIMDTRDECFRAMRKNP